MKAPDTGKRFKVPHVKKPCQTCPYRKDSLKGWLGESRMTEFLASDNFLCHKNHKLQCAGHMILKGDGNVIVRAAKLMAIPVTLEGQELVFENEAECVAHHTTTNKENISKIMTYQAT